MNSLLPLKKKRLFPELKKKQAD